MAELKPAAWRRLEKYQGGKLWVYYEGRCHDDLSPLYTIPDDMVLVPKEPSKAMLIAARDWSYKKYGKPIGNDDAIGCWNAMLAAAEEK